MMSILEKNKSYITQYTAQESVERKTDTAATIDEQSEIAEFLGLEMATYFSKLMGFEEFKKLVEEKIEEIERKLLELQKTIQKTSTINAMEAFSILIDKVLEFKKDLNPNTIVSVIEDETGFNLYLVNSELDQTLYTIAGNMEYEYDLQVYVLTHRQYKALVEGGTGKYEVTDIEVGELEEE